MFPAVDDDDDDLPPPIIAPKPNIRLALFPTHLSMQLDLSDQALLHYDRDVFKKKSIAKFKANVLANCTRKNELQKMMLMSKKSTANTISQLHRHHHHHHHHHHSQDQHPLQQQQQHSSSNQPVRQEYQDEGINSSCSDTQDNQSIEVEDNSSLIPQQQVYQESTADNSIDEAIHNYSTNKLEQPAISSVFCSFSIELTKTHHNNQSSSSNNNNHNNTQQ